MNWKHTYLRKATDEEKKELGCEEIWDGELPCDDSQFLVYKNGYFTIDDWVNDLGECGLTENYDFTDFYWCELEAPDTGKGYGMNDELGVLLLELPEPRVYKYNYIGFSNSKQDGGFKMLYCQTIRQLVNDVFVHKCTSKEAEKFPQFKWVPLSELEEK